MLGNDLFFRELDFSDGLDRLLNELEANTEQLSPKSFEHFLRDCEKREAVNRVYVPVKRQFVKAAALYRSGYVVAKELFAVISLSVGTDGVFQMTVHLDHPLELLGDCSILRHLLWAMRNTDQFSIYPIEKQRFTLVFRLWLYRVIPFLP